MSQNVTKNHCGKDLEQTKQTLGIIMKQQQHQSNPLLRRSSQQGVYTLQIQIFFWFKWTSKYIHHGKWEGNCTSKRKRKRKKEHAPKARIESKSERRNLKPNLRKMSGADAQAIKHENKTSILRARTHLPPLALDRAARESQSRARAK